MWLLKPKPPRTKHVCICGGPYGLSRPNFPYCSPMCAAIAEDKKRFPIDMPDQDLLDALKYP